jgi:hypothetical protein
VVRDEVGDDPQSQVVGPCEQGVRVGERAVPRVDVPVVGHVVAAVGLRGRVERREPDGVGAEGGDVVQARRDAGQVPGPVTVEVGEGPRVDLVDDGGAPPLGRVGFGHVGVGHVGVGHVGGGHAVGTFRS